MIHDVSHEDEVQITVEDGRILSGEIAVPKHAKAVIIFAHGKGSSSRSPRNKYMAEILQKEHFATLLIDLLTDEEAQDDDSQFDVDVLAKRLAHVRQWVDNNPHTEGLMIGLVGSSSGASAALKTVAKLDNNIGAVVSRGGRPYLALDVLDKIKVPVLLLVGGKDKDELKMNQQAFEKLNTTKELQVIEGASHLFSEEGKLEEAAEFTRDWFLSHI
jgi:dienelactone hydrolase